MDLKIIGAGRLGCRVGLLWKKKFPESTIYLKTRTENATRSARWKSQGFIPICDEEGEQHIKAKYVVFSAPPTNNPCYSHDVEAAVLNDWSPEKGGMFVFTGSGSVYTENSGRPINEKSEVKKETDREITLLNSEESVTKNGGVVIRFGGLYEKASKLIDYWLGIEESKEINSCCNGFINLIHYDDAARCIIRVLLSSKPITQLFLVSDGVPITRDCICRAALNCPTYCSRKMPIFTGDPVCIDGKKYQTSLVQETLGWYPMFTSFKEFMEKHHDEELDMGDILP